MPTGAAVGQLAPEGARKKTFRPDIQGLRMVAVVAVILDHLIAWPSGGFVGVDVFFVISGFLITSLLLREHQRTGSISFIGFYRRRIKRILPAATIVIVATIVAAFFLFNRFRATETFWDGVWASFFAANWHFAAVGTDYFQSAGPVSPLQHYWSLSVEEQFYFVWPWVMLLIFALIGRRGNLSRARSMIFGTIVLVTVASFVWSLVETANNPTWAYFSTFSRTWELGIGAIIAVAAGFFAQIPSMVRPVLGWFGLLGILASLFVVSDAVAFPAPWAALPVLSTALVIIAGTGGEQRFLWPLMNPVSSYLGDISYSLYLWHFPLIIFMAPFFPAGSVTFYIICSVTILGISVASYHFVENPIRTSSWLEPRATPKPRHRQPRQIDPKLAYIGAGILAAGVLVLSAAALAPKPVPVAAVAPSPVTSATAEGESAQATDPLAVLSADIAAAANASAWPEFNPSIENIADQRVPQWTENDCINVTPDNVDLCVYGQAAPVKTAVVMGDSIATSWLPAIIGALEPYGYQVRSLTMQGCPVAHAAVFPNGNSTNVYTACIEHQQWAEEQVATIQPDLIIMSDSFLSLPRLVSGATGSDAQNEWETGLSAAIAALPAATPKVTLMAPPGAVNLQECYTPVSSPASCMRPIISEWKTLLAAESAAAAETGTIFVPTQSWFCDGDRCPAFVGTAAVYADSGHLTGTYSTRLSEAVASALTSNGLLG